MSTDNLMPYDEYRETPFHQEWARPQGLVDSVSAVLDKSVTGVAFLSVLRNEANGRVDGAARRRLGLVVPHVRRAVLIGKTIDLRQAEAASLADTLDGMSAGMLFVNSSGRITHANAAGRAMTADGNVLRAPLGRLVASDPDVNRALQDIFLAAANGDAAIGVRGMAVPLVARDGERYVAHVLPLSSGARRSARRGLCGCGCPIRAESRIGEAVPLRGDRQHIPADGDGGARAAGHRRGRRRAASR